MSSDGDCISGLRRALRGAGIIAAALTLVILPLYAQRSRAVTLRISPRSGDTLYTHFEQTVEMSGTSRVGESGSVMTMKSTMRLLSHVVVEESDSLGVTVTAVTDSASLTTWRMGREVPSELARRDMRGKRVQLRVSPDGSATVLEAPDDLVSDVRVVVSAMPSMLPDGPVAVGGTWKKVTAIPMSASTGTRSGEGYALGRAATLRATYRLDSLSGDGNVAFISMSGSIRRDDTAAPFPRGMRVVSEGSITGTMRVDRRRGWWADSRSTIILESVLTPTAAGSADHPMRVRTRIEQHMRAGGGW